MKCFESATEAMREVKGLSEDMGIHEGVLLAYNEYYEEFLVTDDVDELSEEIYKRWLDSGCDSDPDGEANDYKVWEYVLAENEEKYPYTYRDAKKTAINPNTALIRMSKKVEPEHSVYYAII